MSYSQTEIFATTGNQVRGSHITNKWKDGMGIMAFVLATGATGSCTVNVYGSNSLDADTATGKQTLVCTLSPNATSNGSTVGANDVVPTILCYWDFLFFEVVSSVNVASVEISFSGKGK